MCASLQNPYVDILTPKVMVLGGGAFGGDWIMRVETLMNGINVLIRETSETLVPLPGEVTEKRRPSKKRAPAALNLLAP